jgi:translation elongation factor EF-4
MGQGLRPNLPSLVPGRPTRLIATPCYTDWHTRKNKLLDKQKKGKAKMKQIGHVQIPQKAFVSVLCADRS